MTTWRQRISIDMKSNPNTTQGNENKVKCPTLGCLNMKNQSSKTCSFCQRKRLAYRIKMDFVGTSPYRGFNEIRQMTKEL